MSGLYNMVFGRNSFAEAFLHMLGTGESKVPRFRDCWLNKEGTEIVIYTRTGGGNRDYYESEANARKNYPKDFEEDEQPAGPWNEDLRQLPGFIRDVDSTFDGSYAEFYFKVPEQYAVKIKTIVANMDTRTAEEKWQQLSKMFESEKESNTGA
jgi:hypothetical protein